MLIVSIAFLSPPLTRSVLAQPSAEYQLKAAVLHKFLGFVDRPVEDPLHIRSKTDEICLLGMNPFGDALTRIARVQSRSGREVAVKALENPDHAGGCDVVFISKTEAHRLPESLEQLRPHRVLTVSDIPGFAYLGGMIELRLQNRYVRFAINQGAAESSGIRISSQLLALATEVLGSRQGEP